MEQFSNLSNSGNSMNSRCATLNCKITRLPNYQILPGLSVMKQAAILVRFHGATDD
jgi:hypothetical protein